MRVTLILLFSVLLTACDGLDFDSIDAIDSDEQTFTSAELAYTSLFSSSLLTTGNSYRDGYVVIFNNFVELDVINLSVDASNDALIGSYDWTIVNDTLQIEYPNTTTCTSTKTSETDLQYTATSSCDNGSPENSRITGTLIKPVPLEVEDLEGETINLDSDVRYSFSYVGTVNISDIDSDGNIVSSSSETGTFVESTINSVIKIVNSNETEHTLLILLDGDLDSGTMLKLNYTTATDNDDSDTLTKVSIYSITDGSEWESESIYDEIEFDE